MVHSQTLMIWLFKHTMLYLCSMQYSTEKDAKFGLHTVTVHLIVASKQLYEQKQATLATQNPGRV